MKLTKKDLKLFLEKNNYHTKKNVIIKKSIASKWDKKDLCCFIVLQTWQFGRSLEDSIENAEYWSKSDKGEILNIFFKKDIEATF